MVLSQCTVCLTSCHSKHPNTSKDKRKLVIETINLLRHTNPVSSMHLIYLISLFMYSLQWTYLIHGQQMRLWFTGGFSAPGRQHGQSQASKSILVISVYSWDVLHRARLNVTLRRIKPHQTCWSFQGFGETALTFYLGRQQFSEVMDSPVRLARPPFTIIYQWTGRSAFSSFYSKLFSP